MSKAKISRYTSSNSSNQNERIEHGLKQFGLDGMRACFVQLAEENLTQNRTPKDFLEKLLEKQRTYKEDQRIQMWIQRAKFKRMFWLKDYKFKDRSGLDPRLIRELVTGSFIDEGKNIVLLGQSGVGKTHLATGIGIEVIEQGKDVRFIELNEIIDTLCFKCKDIYSQRLFLRSLRTPKLLIVDEVKYYEVVEKVAEIRDFLYQLFRSRCEEGKSMIFTSNQDFSEWEKLLGDGAEAILDRVLRQDKCILINIQGSSSRVPTKTLTSQESLEMSQIQGAT